MSLSISPQTQSGTECLPQSERRLPQVEGPLQDFILHCGWRLESLRTQDAVSLLLVMRGCWPCPECLYLQIELGLGSHLGMAAEPKPQSLLRFFTGKPRVESVRQWSISFRYSSSLRQRALLWLKPVWEPGFWALCHPKETCTVLYYNPANDHLP